MYVINGVITVGIETYMMFTYNSAAADGGAIGLSNMEHRYS